MPLFVSDPDRMAPALRSWEETWVQSRGAQGQEAPGQGVLLAWAQGSKITPFVDCSAAHCVTVGGYFPPLGLVCLYEMKGVA